MWLISFKEVTHEAVKNNHTSRRSHFPYKVSPRRLPPGLNLSSFIDSRIYIAWLNEKGNAAEHYELL